MRRAARAIAAALLLGGLADAPDDALPAPVAAQLPAGYAVLASGHTAFGPHVFYFVALGRPGETAWSDNAQPRPLLIFERRSDGGYTLAGRNDHAVLRADEGGQCDPFEDGAITAKGRYFTVENNVACGNHWTYYVTFRFESRLGYVFDNLRTESWSSNPSNAPDAEALVSGGMHVTRGAKGRPVRFTDWRER